MHAVNLESSGKTAEDTKFDKMHLRGKVMGQKWHCSTDLLPSSAIYCCSVMFLFVTAC